MTRVAMFAVLLIVLLAAAGCGPSGPAIVPVTGVVTLDGVPVAKASVMFKPVAGGNAAEGETDASGKFSLTTQLDKPRAGALEGEHIVTVNGARTIGTQAAGDGTSVEAKAPQIEWFVPMKYANGNTSGLRQTVSKGMSPVELKLSTK
jgi:hypothetical protein